MTQSHKLSIIKIKLYIFKPIRYWNPFCFYRENSLGTIRSNTKLVDVRAIDPESEKVDIFRKGKINCH